MTSGSLPIDLVISGVSPTHLCALRLNYLYSTADLPPIAGSDPRVLSNTAIAGIQHLSH